MGAATTAGGEASPTQTPGYAMYGKNGTNGQSPDRQQHMTVIEDDDSAGDVNQPPSLIVADLDNATSPLRGLYKLRKNRSFCDVILQVLYTCSQCPSSAKFAAGRPSANTESSLFGVYVLRSTLEVVLVHWLSLSSAVYAVVMCTRFMDGGALPGLGTLMVVQRFP